MIHNTSAAMCLCVLTCRSKVLLIRSGIACVLVAHVRYAQFCLNRQYGIPQFSRLDHTTSLSWHGLVLHVQCVERIRMLLGQSGCFIRTEQTPRSVGLDSLHEQVVDPQSVEQVSRSLLLDAVILLQIKKCKDVRTPWL